MILGVTGGIGAGKSYVCGVFQSLGVPIYSSDTRAKLLLAENPEVIAKVTELLGDVYVDGQPDRQQIAEKVFADKALLDQLNAIIHPAVAIDFASWLKEQSSSYVIKEAAILIESGAHKQVDKLLVVTADEEVRIQRVCERDNVSPEAVKARMTNQMSEDERLDHADFIVRNNPGDMILPQVLEIHNLMINAGTDS